MKSRRALVKKIKQLDQHILLEQKEARAHLAYLKLFFYDHLTTIVAVSLFTVIIVGWHSKTIARKGQKIIKPLFKFITLILLPYTPNISKKILQKSFF